MLDVNTLHIKEFNYAELPIRGKHNQNHNPMNRDRINWVHNIFDYMLKNKLQCVEVLSDYDGNDITKASHLYQIYQCINNSKFSDIKYTAFKAVCRETRLFVVDSEFKNRR